MLVRRKKKTRRYLGAIINIEGISGEDIGLLMCRTISLM
jgi:hypothetical protein